MDINAMVEWWNHSMMEVLVHSSSGILLEEEKWIT